MCYEVVVVPGVGFGVAGVAAGGVGMVLVPLYPLVQQGKALRGEQVLLLVALPLERLLAPLHWQLPLLGLSVLFPVVFEAALLGLT